MIVALMMIAMLKTLPSPSLSSSAACLASWCRALLITLCLLASGCVVNPVPTPGESGFAAAPAAALDAVGSEQSKGAGGATSVGGEHDNSAEDVGATTDTDTISSADGQQVDADQASNDADTGGRK